MKLEDQVCSLELAKRLKELGVKQVSEFYWNCDTDHWTSKSCVDTKHWILIQDNGNEREGYSAFTVAELGEMLDGKGISDLVGGAWYGYDQNEFKISGPESTEADARAKMLIYLIENKIIKPEELNP